MTSTTVGFDSEIIEAARALFEEPPPAEEAYDDTTEVTVTLTKGQAYLIRGAIRNGAVGFLQNVDMVESFGMEPPPEVVKATNDTLRDVVAVDRALAPLAPVADYPQPEKDEADDDPFAGLGL